MDSVMFDQAALAAISVWVIQKLKAWAKLPAVHDGADRLLRLLAALAAMLSAAGILVTANWNGVEGTLSLIVTGITVNNLLLFLWTAVKSMIGQELIWRLVKSSKPPKALSAG